MSVETPCFKRCPALLTCSKSHYKLKTKYFFQRKSSRNQVCTNPSTYPTIVIPHPAPCLRYDAPSGGEMGMTDVGKASQRVMRRRMRSQVRAFGLRRDSARCQSRPHWNRKRASARLFMGTPYTGMCPRTTACNHCLFGGDEGFVHTNLKCRFTLIQLRLQPFAYRLPQHRETGPLLSSLRRCVVNPGSYRLRFRFSTPCRCQSLRTELHIASLGCIPVELPHSFR